MKISQERLKEIIKEEVSEISLKKKNRGSGLPGLHSTMAEWYEGQEEFMKPYHEHFAKTFVGHRIRVENYSGITEGTVSEARMGDFEYGDSFAEFTFKDGIRKREGKPDKKVNRIYIDKHDWRVKVEIIDGENS